MRGRDCSGRWYPRPDRISIFVNKIAEHIDVDTPLFEAAIGAICAHEVVHIIGFRGGCKSGVNCRAGKCFWCRQTYEILEYLL